MLFLLRLLPPVVLAATAGAVTVTVTETVSVPMLETSPALSVSSTSSGTSDAPTPSIVRGFTFDHTLAPTPQVAKPEATLPSFYSVATPSPTISPFKFFTLVVSPINTPPELRGLGPVQYHTEALETNFGRLGWYDPEGLVFTGFSRSPLHRTMILNADHPDFKGVGDKRFLSPTFDDYGQDADHWGVWQTNEEIEALHELSSGFYIGERNIPEPVKKVIKRGRDVLDWEERRGRAWMACPVTGGWDLMMNLDPMKEPMFDGCTQSFDLEVAYEEM